MYYQCWLVISRRKPNWSLQCNHEQDIQFNFLISTNNKVQQYLNIWIPTGIQKCLINLFSLFGYNHAIIFTERHLTIILRFYFVSYRKILLPVTFLKLQVVSHNPNQMICWKQIIPIIWQLWDSVPSKGFSTIGNVFLIVLTSWQLYWERSPI